MQIQHAKVNTNFSRSNRSVKNRGRDIFRFCLLVCLSVVFIFAHSIVQPCKCVLLLTPVIVFYFYNHPKKTHVTQFCHNDREYRCGRNQRGRKGIDGDRPQINPPITEGQACRDHFGTNYCQKEDRKGLRRGQDVACPPLNFIAETEIANCPTYIIRMG